MTAREIAEKFFDDHFGPEVMMSISVSSIEHLIVDAEKRGMLRAEEIVLEHKDSACDHECVTCENAIAEVIRAEAEKIGKRGGGGLKIEIDPSLKPGEWYLKKGGGE